MKRKIFNLFTKFYTILIFLFLYIPLFVIIIYSFNASKTNAVWTGVTLNWYSRLFNDDNVMTALKNSLTIAFFSTVLSSIFGTIGAVGMYSYNFKGKSLIDLLLYIPIVIPEIIMGVSLLIYFSWMQVPFGIVTIVLSHATFSIPFVLIVVKARLAGFDSAIEDAAKDLGADKFKTFITITLPLILPGVLSGAMLAFALSLDDVIINFFVGGPESTTLPIKIFSMLRFGLSPEINALCTIMLFVTFIILVTGQLFNSSKKEKTI